MYAEAKWKIEERYDLWRLVTFLPNEKLPVHRWFHYKEGFSRDLVQMLLSQFGLTKGTVLDPFVGAGTTPLTCMELGYDSIGIDASPLAVLVSYAKTRIYDPATLERYLEDLLAKPFVRIGFDDLKPITIKSFDRSILSEVLSIREHVSNIEDFDYRSFFTLALMIAAMKCSYAFKDGSIIRIIKRPVPSLRPTFKRVVKRMIEDVKSVRYSSGPALVMKGDARRLEGIADESVDAIITSPPYLNKIEYTKVYEIEEDLFLQPVKKEMMRSYIGLTPRSNRRPSIDIDGLPDSAVAYLADMEDALREMHRVLSYGGRAAIVVAGGVYPGLIVHSDLLLATIAETIGFEIDKLVAVNRRVATTARIKKIGEARESIIYLSKS